MSMKSTGTQALAMSILALIAVLIGMQSFANRPVEQSQSEVVATFDLERTFNTLDEKVAAFATLPQIAEDLEKKSTAMRKEIEGMEAELKLHGEGSPKRMEIERKLLLAVGNYRAHVEFSKMKLEAEQGRLIKRTYMSIRDAVAELAEANSYALVLVNDSLAEFPPGTVEDLNRQISARRVMYSKYDITDELIAFMNEKFRKSGGAVPASAGANPPPAASAP